MNGRLVLLGSCAAVLLAGGYWLGRSSSASAPTSAPTTPVRTAQLPVIAAAPAPALPPPPVLPARAVDPTLAKDLVDPDPKVRRAALAEAIREPDVDVQTLLAASRDSDLEVSAVATVALGTAYARGDVAVTELIARATDTSRNEKVRMAALNGLGAVASPEAVALLDRLASSGTPAERASAAILLQNQAPDLAVPILIRTLADSDAHVRECAHDSLKARARGRDFGEDAAAWRAWWTSRH